MHILHIYHIGFAGKSNDFRQNETANDLAVRGCDTRSNILAKSGDATDNNLQLQVAFIHDIITYNSANISAGQKFGNRLPELCGKTVCRRVDLTDL